MYFGKNQQLNHLNYLRASVFSHLLTRTRMPQQCSNKFGIVFGLDKFLTLDNENKFSLFSLNRNFALPFATRKVGGASTMLK